MASYSQFIWELFDPDQPSQSATVEEQKRPAYEDPNRGVAVTGRDYVHETYSDTFSDGETQTNLIPITLEGASKVSVGLDAASGQASVFVRFYYSDARNTRAGRKGIILNESVTTGHTDSLPSPYMSFDIRDDTSDSTDHTYDIQIMVQ